MPAIRTLVKITQRFTYYNVVTVGTVFSKSLEKLINRGVWEPYHWGCCRQWELKENVYY